MREQGPTVVGVSLGESSSLAPPPAVIDIKLDKPQEPPASEGGCSC